MKSKGKSVKTGTNTNRFLAFLLTGLFLASMVPLVGANLGWNCRRGITINNTGSALTDYQVLVTLNNSNFDYSKANSDGSDIRFTNYANTTKYSYWIE